MRMIAIVVLLLIADTTFAHDWTRFRGPNGSGISEDDSIPAQWAKSDFAWQIELPGKGHSSPVIWGDRLFIQSADPKTGMQHVLGINTGDGKIVWKRDYPKSANRLHGKSSYASSTPAVDADYVYAAWADPEHTILAAFDHDGAEQWTIDLGGWVGQHGFGTSPMIIDDLVILGSSQEPEKRADGDTPRDTFVAAVDRKSGKLRWKTPRAINTASYSVPCIRKSENGREELIFLSTAEGIFALDPQTGSETWSTGDKTFTMRTVSSPVLWKDLIVGTTGSGGGGNYIVAHRPGQAAPVYEIKKEAPYVPTPVVDGDLMFLWSDKGIVTCIEAATGNQVWQKRVGGGYSGSPVRAGNKIFCVDEEGTVVAVAAEREFKELGRNPLGEQSHSTPAIAGGRLYVRTVSHLHAINGKK